MPRHVPHGIRTGGNTLGGVFSEIGVAGTDRFRSSSDFRLYKENISASRSSE